MGLHIFKKALVVDEDGLYQWTVTTNALLSANQPWYELDLFSHDELEELRRINTEHGNIDRGNSSPETMEHQLEKLYEDLENLHVKMRKTILTYHQQAKGKPEAKSAYTLEAPPQLTLFDEFTAEHERKPDIFFHILSWIFAVNIRLRNRFFISRLER